MTPKISEEILKKHGLRVTPRRLAVYELFAKARKPLDVREIKNSLLLTIKINKATIYRILTAFLQNNLIAQVELAEGKFRYERADKMHHHHLVCLKCNRIQDIGNCSISRLEDIIRRKLSFAVKTHKLEFFGICGQCQIRYNNL